MKGGSNITIWDCTVSVQTQKAKTCLSAQSVSTACQRERSHSKTHGRIRVTQETRPGTHCDCVCVRVVYEVRWVLYGREETTKLKNVKNAFSTKSFQFWVWFRLRGLFLCEDCKFSQCFLPQLINMYLQITTRGVTVFVEDWSCSQSNGISSNPPSTTASWMKSYGWWMGDKRKKGKKEKT